MSSGDFLLRILERFQNVVLDFSYFRFQNVTFIAQDEIPVSVLLQFPLLVLLVDPPPVPTPARGLIVEVSHAPVLQGGHLVIRQQRGLAVGGGGCGEVCLQFCHLVRGHTRRRLQRTTSLPEIIVCYLQINFTLS